MTQPIVVTRRVAASPSVVYSYLTESSKWARWQGAEAVIEPVTGGNFTMRMPDGKTARGQFVELVPNRRVVFTWGWVGHPRVPPGSSTVEIEITVDGDGSLITLTHRGLPPEELRIHSLGWDHYMNRLGRLVETGEIEPDRGPPG